MKIDVVSIFPEIIRCLSEFSIVKRARDKGLVDINALDLREFTDDRHRTVDDAPYGGGAGMVMKPEPFFLAVDHLLQQGPADEIIVLSPAGKSFDQKAAEKLACCQRLIFLCGHYEGIDQRVADHLATMELSIGDYVLTGGELAAMVVVDSVTRLLPGAVGNQQSLAQESFCQGLLEYPQYTRPPVFRGHEVPQVLLSGNHQEIANWRRRMAEERTKRRRPDLVEDEL